MRSAAPVVLVAAAALLGGLIAVWSYEDDAELSVGRVSLEVSPFHHGALDAYVPLVDWGVRFPGVHVPARLKIRLDSIDRTEARRIAADGLPATHAVRSEVRDVLTGYLIRLALLAAAAALALGALTAAALQRGRVVFRRLLAVAGGCAVAWMLVIALLLAPRGDLAEPTYYGHGSDIPVALRTAEAAMRASGELTVEVDDQLLGLARLVVAPGERSDLEGLPRLTIASDVHNNVLSVPVIRRTAARGPLLLAGDLTDRGTVLEFDAIRGLATAGRPVVFVPGNHDSDTSSRRMAQAGAIVLSRSGRLRADGTRGPVVNRVAGLRIAGYESPNRRTRLDGYRDHGAAITHLQQQEFAAWLRNLTGRVDVVMIHEPQLAEPALRALRRHPPSQPLLVVEGHTHQQAVRSAGDVTEVNGGTAGAGGTGNLYRRQPIGLAVVTYRAPAHRGPASEPFEPLAADLVTISPGTGDATARRVRLDRGDVAVGDTSTPAEQTTTD